jgi:iron complex outermembrane receptor protein
MNLGSGLAWNADLRWIGRLPDPMVPAYVELNTSLAWNISDRVEVSLSGFNLLHARHLEYTLDEATGGNEVERSVFLRLKGRV